MKTTRASSAFRLPPSALESAIAVALTNQQQRRPVKAERLIAGVKAVMQGEGITRANVSIAVVDDSTIQAINRQYLQHDYPTDVISFVLEQNQGFVEGDIIVSAETAAAAAGRFGWTVADELLLYVIHGTLHLTGVDDATSQTRRLMRQKERMYLELFGLKPRAEEFCQGERRP